MSHWFGQRADDHSPKPYLKTLSQQVCVTKGGSPPKKQAVVFPFRLSISASLTLRLPPRRQWLPEIRMSSISLQRRSISSMVESRSRTTGLPVRCPWIQVPKSIAHRRADIRRIIEAQGFESPEICSAEEMFGERV